MNTDDAELLQRYLENNSEPAFTALVRRHIGLVYSVALRRVGGDTHLAEDVAQKVFVDLARKAASLTGRHSLSGWLFAGAHVASAAVVRSEQRRKARETEAQLMHTTLSPDGSDPDETRLRPVVDELIADLKDKEREVIALRFFERRSFAEVGQALSVTEEAARKRVDRSLEKLRTLLERRGITSTAAALGLVLTAIADGTAPASLTAKVASHAIAHGTASTWAAATAPLTSALLPTLAVLVMGGFLIGAQRRTNDELRRELAQAGTELRAIATLRSENARLARSLSEIEAPPPRPAHPILPAPTPVVSPPIAPRAVSAQIGVSPAGRLMWDQQPVNLHEFIARLRTLQETADPESRVVIRALDAEFPALNYVIEEIRKAQLNHVTVESNAAPNPKLGWSWF